MEGIKLLKDHPVLQACAELDLRPLAASARTGALRRDRSPLLARRALKIKPVAVATCRPGIRFTVYLDEAHRLSNGITAVHVHIPGLERFHMIVDGPAAVVPGRRGMAAVEVTAPACPV